MSTVLFVITIPTETEESRLKDAFLTGTTSETQSETQQETKSTKSVMTDGVQIDEIVITPVTTNNNKNNNNNVPPYGTFPKRAKSKSIKINGPGTSSARRKSWDDLQDLIAPSIKITNEHNYNVNMAANSNKNRKQTGATIDLSNDSCMEIVLREILKRYQIQNAVWIKDAHNCMFQVIFTTEFDEVYENLLDTLHDWGIGDREGSTVSVVNCIASKTFISKADVDFNNEYDKQNNAQKQGAWNRFMNSVRSRLNVAQVVRDVRQDAAITFDFIVSLIAAAILASFGLAEDNTILLVSSMLISPLMGPIIAVIFGTVIKDKPLRTLGLRNELLGILLSTAVGFVFGLVVASVDERYNAGIGPTAEMMSRCDLYSLLEGVLTAIPSGAAAAISILGGNIGSLVGVAISASLLPPAVNTGLLWAFAFVYKFFESDDARFNHMVKTERYSKDQAIELAVLGSISLCLTLSNVICIYVMGILVLKVKEIAPIISRNNRQFWKHDIKIARDINMNGYDSDTAIINDLAANMPQADQEALGLTGELLRNMHLEEAIYRTWSPMPVHPTHPALHQLNNVYSTVAKPQEMRPRFSINCYPTTRFKDYENPYAMVHERRATLPTKFLQPLPNHLTLSEASHSERTSATTTPTSMKNSRRQRKFIVTPAEDPLRRHQDLEATNQLL